MNDGRNLFRVLSSYFLVTYLVILGISSSCMASLDGAGIPATIVAAIQVLSSSLLYLMPALALTIAFMALLLVRTRPAVWKILNIGAMATLAGMTRLMQMKFSDGFPDIVVRPACWVCTSFP